jgi:restriction endonuclease Mrr
LTVKGNRPVRGVSTDTSRLVREVRATLAAVMEEFPHINGDRIWHLLTQLRVLYATLEKMENGDS